MARAVRREPGPPPAEDSRGGQGLVQRGERFGEPAGEGPALGKCPVQVDPEIRLCDVGQRLAGHPLGFGGVADPVQGLSEAALQALVRGSPRVIC